MCFKTSAPRLFYLNKVKDRENSSFWNTYTEKCLLNPHYLNISMFKHLLSNK